MGYQTSFFSGITWSGGLKISAKVLSAVKIAIIARLLPVEYFGVFSLVLVSISLVEVFTESGINTIIVQSKKSIEYYIDTAWVISIIRGFLIALVMTFLGVAMSSFYQNPDLLILIACAALTPVIRGFINPSIIGFYKNLSFRKDSIYRFSLTLVESISTVLLAYLFRSPFALVIPILISSFFDLFISFRFTKQKPRFRLKKSVFFEIMQGTKWLNGISVIDYLNKNIDDLILGKLIGTQLLGFYSKAYTVSQAGTAELGVSVIHASFPVYTRISQDITRLRRAFYKVFLSSAFVLLLPMSIFIFLPQLVVDILLGKNWQAVVLILPLLGVAGYIQALMNIGSTLFTAKKKYMYLLTVLLVTFGSMVLLIIPLSKQYGLYGAALSIVLSRVITLPIFMISVFRTLHPKNEHP